jgi:hypothetical protein
LARARAAALLGRLRLGDGEGLGHLEGRGLLPLVQLAQDLLAEPLAHRRVHGLAGRAEAVDARRERATSADEPRGLDAERGRRALQDGAGEEVAGVRQLPARRQPAQRPLPHAQRLHDAGRKAGEFRQSARRPDQPRGHVGADNGGEVGRDGVHARLDVGVHPPLERRQRQHRLALREHRRERVGAERAAVGRRRRHRHDHHRGGGDDAAELDGGEVVLSANLEHHPRVVQRRHHQRLELGEAARVRGADGAHERLDLRVDLEAHLVAGDDSAVLGVGLGERCR